MKAKNALTVAMAAGIASAAAASNTPTTLGATQANIQHTAHIYYNVATGERVVTPITDSQTAPADAGNGPIWAALIGNACASAGFTTSFFFGVDDPGTTALSTEITNVDIGDIATDTVVDCVQINWLALHPDTEINTPGLGDGVEELAGEWTIWDADNGRAIDQSTRMPLISFLFTNLPGNIAEPGFVSVYTADIDLAADFTGTDLTFEIGDSDGDCQGAAFCNSSILDMSTGMMVPIAQADNNFDGLPDADLDGDGLFDWSWSVRFYQPGTGNDFDSDMDTGTPAATDEDTIGILFGSPEGTAIDNGDGTWTYEIDTMAAAPGTGAEDGFAIYGPPDIDGNTTHEGFFWFGGFSCDGTPGVDSYTPPAHFQFVLYGPDGGTGGPCSPADLNNDGMLNFFDVSLFLQGFNMGADYNGDGQTNFFDVSQFLQDFNAGGCP